MTNLYIANPTKQDHRFTYRLPGNLASPTQKTIKAGQQIEIKDLDRSDIDAIVAQHEIYGMCKAEEFSRRRHIAHLCYSEGAPVDIDRMLQTYEVNDEKLDENAQARREQTAAAVNRLAAETIKKETGVNVGPPAKLTMETVKENPGPEEGGPLAAGVEIVNRDIKKK